MKYKIKIINKTKSVNKKKIINKWNLIDDQYAKFSLILQANRIELQDNTNKKEKNIWINFNYQNFQQYKKDYKRKIIKAVKIKKKKKINILDATAGLGKDAFILFSHGYNITMIERNPILSILLEDGLKRGFKDKMIGTLIKKKMKLIYASSININQMNLQKPDVIYIDPMFPSYKQKSLPKKNIKIIKKIVGSDLDSINLFHECMKFSVYKIVVKRPKTSSYISCHKPSYSIKTKKYRFDIYINHKIKI
ncbi:class I SAM-dependent methyltransferase [Buchnera aphidicola]|uniref:class I SAM-dependent methyltransferase n=1 Tax=Buchnera aphidicola TaxID=9 RepID=UPI0031B88EA5